MPVRVPLTQSPVFFLWQDWALGAMYTKITIALTFMGPDWWLKAAIEQLYQVSNKQNFIFTDFVNIQTPATCGIGNPAQRCQLLFNIVNFKGSIIILLWLKKCVKLD